MLCGVTIDHQGRGWKPVLGRALAMEWVSRVIFLEAAICVAGNLSVNAGRGYPRKCIQAGYWGSLYTTGDYSTCIIQSDINMPSMSGTAPRRAGKFSCRKAKRQCGYSYGSWMSSPSGVLFIPAEDYFRCLLLLWC